MPLSVLYRDEQLVAVDKPSGLLVHRGWARDRDVAMTLLRDQLGQWVYPVHRLDRGTSGVLLFALDKTTAAAVGEQFQEGSIRKRYLALVRGVPPEQVRVDHAIPGRPGGPRVEAVTEVECGERFGRYSTVVARPLTGRLHQIRRHLKHLSCPIIGDVNYGKGAHNRLFRDQYNLHRLALHALELCVTHPRTGERLSVHAPLAPDLASAIAQLANQAPPSIT